MSTRFASVILDVDSTLSGIEGIDWLAHRRGPEVAHDVAELTNRAMAGEILLDEVYGLRLDLVRPTRDDIAALADAYVTSIAPGALAAVGAMRAAGVEVVLISGGIREAIKPLAATVGLHDAQLHAVSVSFDEDGNYRDYDRQSPLATQAGKATVARALELTTPVLAVGDGATDLAMRGAVDAFAAFSGFVQREPVIEQADFVVRSFTNLRHLVFS